MEGGILNILRQGDYGGREESLHGTIESSTAGGKTERTMEGVGGLDKKGRERERKPRNKERASIG